MAFKGFGLSKQPPAPEPAPIVLTEQMLITDLPTEACNDFINVFNSIQENMNPPEVSVDNSVEKDVKEISEETMRIILGSLTSLARQIDSAKSGVAVFKTELDNSKEDLNNSSHIRTTPTPFITRYVDKLDMNASRLTQAINSYDSKFNTNTNVNNPNLLPDFLSEQHRSLLRCSSKTSRIREKFENVRMQFSTRLHIRPEQMQIIESQVVGSDSDSCVRGVQNLLAEFKADKKRKEQKRDETSDLFGASSVAAPAQTKGLGLGLGASRPALGGRSALGAK